ncbi:hypothetical protein DID88_001980 [Monilinia fructigena]|uniref:Rhodopsin domain-containing protein n=1 Tax=Monilinia fructigena TaxID=38457 RepID=A0A395IW22_9HELO|nr:hypothetical protein DID88_001980 [Monilinia fructigena]
MYISTYDRVSRQAESTPTGSKIGLDTHNFQIVTVDIVLLILTTSFIGLRLYSRKLQGLRYGAEDWSILGALVVFYCYIGVSFAAIFGGGIGYHANQLSAEQTKLSLILILIIQFVYAVGQGLVKSSICLLLMRIFSTRKFRIAASIIMGLCIAWSLMTILIAFLICRPLDYNWNLKPPGNHCGDQKLAYGSVGVVDILTDTCILILPIPMIWNLQMPKLNKFLLACILGFGVFTISVTIVRVIVIANTNFLDFSYSSKGIFIWTAVNYGTGIIVACCPLLRPVVEKLYPKSLIQTLRSKSASITTSITGSNPRRHLNFDRLGDDRYPLHDMGSRSVGPKTEIETVIRDEEFLRGQSGSHNNLYPIFENWPQGINAEVDSIRPDIEQKLESLFPGDPRLEKLKAADFSMFGSCWWPNASIERLRILFVWDDELDSEIGKFSNDFDKGQDYRSDTRTYLYHCLSIGKVDPGDEPSNAIIRSFKVIGDAICEVYTEAQRQILLEELLFFMDCSEIEQRVRLSEKLPTVEEYWRCRMGTSAVGVTTAMNEFAIGSEVSTMMINTSMKALWDYTNEIVWLVNDILSIKKELEQNTVDSLIPLLYIDAGSAQAAIDSAVASLHVVVNGFDKLANDLIDQYRSDEITQAALQRFLDACRHNCTGNLNWSLQTQRYGICQEASAEGISINL